MQDARVEKPSARWPHPLNILCSDDAQNVSQAADFSSKPQTPLSNHWFHIITWADNGQLKSNMFQTKLLIFLPNPVLPTVCLSLLMATPYFQLLRPNKLESSLTPVFLSHCNLILPLILLCLQRTSMCNNISPRPPDPTLSSPICIPARVMQQGLPSFALVRRYKKQVMPKMVSQIM